ncbi:14670_t:CDS:1, partial [Acaulospora morrowiae]
LTDEQIQEVIDYGISSEKLPLVTNHVTKISETLCPGKILSEVSESTAIPIPSSHIEKVLSETEINTSSASQDLSKTE